MTYRTVRFWKRDAGFATALLVKIGRKQIHLVPMDADGIRCLKQSKDQLERLTDVTPGPLEAAKRLLDAGKRFGITCEARRHLETAIRELRTQ